PRVDTSSRRGSATTSDPYIHAMDADPVAARNADVGVVPTVHRSSGGLRFLSGAACAMAIGLLGCTMIAVTRDARYVGDVLLTLLVLAVGAGLVRFWWRERSTVVEIGALRVVLRRAGAEQACAWSDVRAVETTFVPTAGVLGLGEIRKVYRSLT